MHLPPTSCTTRIGEFCVVECNNDIWRATPKIHLFQKEVIQQHRNLMFLLMVLLIYHLFKQYLGILMLLLMVLLMLLLMVLFDGIIHLWGHRFEHVI